MAQVRFNTKLIASDHSRYPNVAGVSIAPDVIEKLGGRGRIPIKGTVNGFPFRTTIVRMGGEHFFCVNREMREGAGGIGPGDHARFIIQNDNAERTIAVPRDVAAALNKGKAREAFDTFSYWHRKEWVLCVEAAKRPETRTRRIGKLVEEVLQKSKARAAKKSSRPRRRA